VRFNAAGARAASSRQHKGTELLSSLFFTISDNVKHVKSNQLMQNNFPLFTLLFILGVYDLRFAQIINFPLSILQEVITFEE
jgi:hypothetical protein